MAPLDAHAEAKDTDTDTSGSQNGVANIDEKQPASPPSDEEDAGETPAGDDVVRTVHGIKVCTTSAKNLAGYSGTLN